MDAENRKFFPCTNKYQIMAQWIIFLILNNLNTYPYKISQHFIYRMFYLTDGDFIA